MLDRMLEILLEERGEALPAGMDQGEQERLLRALCNVRPAQSVSAEFLRLQDAWLQEKTHERGVVEVQGLSFEHGVALWQGDITRLAADAIVNACNPALLGCFQPLHDCIDNVIHSWAGVQVRLDCDQAMGGTQLPNGQVVQTSAYNLPSRYIFHTVGPIVRHGRPTDQQARELADCYRSSLELAVDMGLESVAFCCISTGVYGYPQDLAAQLAVRTVKQWLAGHQDLRVIFNVYLDADREHYEHELRSQASARP